ncbi:C40 family peptidase [Pseudofrankia sp. DC12]|uniref:C40 family peptidase n=1 Tax=Pseudofrankia sp. DC12 TaxID=683315 RepID=UPI0005F8136A|nr:C40 family peptidase [Pseudofrankia sp. DC12]
MALSGVALTGSLGPAAADSDTGAQGITANLLGAALGSAATPAADPTSELALPVAFRLRTAVSLAPAVPDVTVNADEPVEVGFRLTTRGGGALADRDILVQALFPSGWTTFKALRTDAGGYASYTARVLTTTQIRATFAGSQELEAVTSDPAVVRVHPAPPAPVLPAASRAPAGETVTVAPTGATTIGEKAVYLASLQAGKPYVYGAEGPYSFDCSGLVQYVYRQLGKTLPRTTDQQFAATIRIARGSEQPGDLIFFGEPGSIYHEGIYAGDGKIWVAPKSGDVVKLETIWTSSYSVGRVR